MKKFRMTETITNRDSDAFKKYLLEVANIPVLSTDEEYEIAMLAHLDPKDTTNVDLLVKHNLRFVISVAKQYATNDLKLEDLVNLRLEDGWKAQGGISITSDDDINIYAQAMIYDPPEPYFDRGPG